MNFVNFLRLITVLGPKFKELMPILLSIIEELKALYGGNTSTTPGFSPAPPTAEHQQFVKEAVDAGCDADEATQLANLIQNK